MRAVIDFRRQHIGNAANKIVRSPYLVVTAMREAEHWQGFGGKKERARGDLSIYG